MLDLTIGERYLLVLVVVVVVVHVKRVFNYRAGNRDDQINMLFYGLLLRYLVH
jgi:hypothetical protein